MDYLSKRVSSTALISTTTVEAGRLERTLIFIKSTLTLLYSLIFYRPDLVHMHMASRGSFLRKSILCLLCQLFRTPYIIHLHGGGFKDFYKELPAAGKKYLRFIFRRATCTIALSKIWKDWIESELKTQNVVTVPNGVNDISFLPGEIDKSNPTVLFLGLLGKNKGTDILIESMREVVKRIPNAVLELCGNGDIDHYKEQARNIPNVKFLGWINADERRAALGRASVYCLPSWKEGLPFSILEAMSASLPIISTPVGSIPEAVEDGVTGLLVNPGDVQGLASAICHILLSPETAKSMGEMGKNLQLEKFSSDAMGRRCLEIYKEYSKK
jgi:glycosyltransferase involved in cell wall biosynthesis